MDDFHSKLLDLVQGWIYEPGRVMGLSDEQLAFIGNNSIHICTSYIGMVRLYKGNCTIWQTSVSRVIDDAISRSREPRDFEMKSSEAVLADTRSEYLDLSKQCRDFIDELMSMSVSERDLVFNRNLPLF